MSFTLNDGRLEVERAIGIAPDERIDVESIVNDAGQYLFGMHDWCWRKRPEVPLSTFAPITITNGTWTESSLTLTKTSAFTSYTHVPGDAITITDGTGATTGSYVIASKTSANAIVLDTSIGSGADGQTDIDGTIQLPRLTLPDDFGYGQIKALHYNGTIGIEMQKSSLEQIRYMRRDDVDIEGVVYYAPSYPSQASTSVSPGQAILEIHPIPSAAVTGAYWLTYLAGWTVLSGSAVANVPVWMESLLRDMIRAFAHKAKTGTNEQIEMIENSAMLQRLKQQDGKVQSNLGRMKGGYLSGTTRVRTVIDDYMNAPS